MSGRNQAKRMIDAFSNLKILQGKLSRERVRQVILTGSVLLIFAFLIMPVIVIILTSFTPERFPSIPTKGFSFEWYIQLIRSDRLLNALTVSFIVAACSSLLSVIMGTIAAFGFVRSEFPYKDQLSTAMLFPMIISPVITGIALVRYFGTIGLPSGYPSLIVGHMVLTFPYVFLLIRSELLTFDRNLEKASRVLGADPSVTFFNITAPVISPAIISGFFVAFVVSFGEYTATQFLISPGTTTVPVIIYTMLRSGLLPTISALSTILVVVMLIAAVAGRYLSR